MGQLAASFLVILFAALAVNAQYPYQGSTGAGAVGAAFGQQTTAQENHDKKNFGLNFSSDKGSSSNTNNVAAQAGAAGSYAQGSGYYPGGWGWAPPAPGGWGVPPPPPPPPHGWGR